MQINIRDLTFDSLISDATSRFSSPRSKNADMVFFARVRKNSINVPALIFFSINYFYEATDVNLQLDLLISDNHRLSSSYSFVSLTVKWLLS